MNSRIPPYVIPTAPHVVLDRLRAVGDVHHEDPALRMTLVVFVVGLSLGWKITVASVIGTVIAGLAVWVQHSPDLVALGFVATLVFALAGFDYLDRLAWRREQRKQFERIGIQEDDIAAA